MVAVRDHLAHQRGVVGGDVIADELRHVHEAHDPVVEADPLVHLAQFDIADDVVQSLEEALGSSGALDVAAFRGRVPGQVAARIAVAVDHALDQSVPGLAVGRDRR